MPYFMIVLILYMNLLNFSWIKSSIFEAYEVYVFTPNHLDILAPYHTCPEMEEVIFTTYLFV